MVWGFGTQGSDLESLRFKYEFCQQNGQRFSQIDQDYRVTQVIETRKERGDSTSSSTEIREIIGK